MVISRSVIFQFVVLYVYLPMDISNQSCNILEKLFDEKLKPVLNVTNNLEKQLEGILHSLDFISSQYDAIQQKYEKYEAILKESCQENDR